jgi:hypothetical protein
LGISYEYQRLIELRIATVSEINNGVETENCRRGYDFVVSLTIRAAVWLTSSDVWPGQCALFTWFAKSSESDRSDSERNGILQTEQRWKRPSRIKCAGPLSLTFFAMP